MCVYLDPAGAVPIGIGGAPCTMGAVEARRPWLAPDGGHLMADDRLFRILQELVDKGEGGRSSVRLCQVSTDIVAVTGSGVMLMSEEGPWVSLCASNEVSRTIENLQYMLGEGPGLDACMQGQVVFEPDLADPTLSRWSAFTAAALEAGARALFAFPLLVNSVRLGALDLYRDRPGPLSVDQHADALVMADVTARWVLDRQAEAPSGAVAPDLEMGADFHLTLNNAAGMLSVQLGSSVTEALVRLRAHAFGSDRQLGDVAEDVLARRLRIERDPTLSLMAKIGAKQRSWSTSATVAAAERPTRRG